jgi:hypothetical protein
MGQSAHHRAIDKRILSAFYTQYLAVLLIVLVACIAMFSTRAGAVKANVDAAPQVQTRFAGSKALVDPFVDNEPTLKYTIELEAIAATLREHDLQATFRLVETESDVASIAQALPRLDAIRIFMEERGVPSAAIRTVISDAGPRWSVSFDVMEERDE